MTCYQVPREEKSMNLTNISEPVYLINSENKLWMLNVKAWKFGALI